MPPKKPRCPNGSRRKPPKTGICVKNNSNIKECPRGKILNKKTNRCINDNPANRKRLKKESEKKQSVKKLSVKKENINSISCKKYNNIVDMDLNNITVEKQISTKKFKINYNDDSNKFTLDNITFLSEGSYGEVYKYSKGKYGIAIKTYKYNDDDEINIINMLHKEKIPCEVINSKLLKIQDKYICAMELMSGPLSKIKGKLIMNNNIKCIKKIAEHLKCLNDHKLSYTDLKCANILFKCINNKNIKIVLGDVGSICKTGQEHIATFPPWEYRNDVGHVKCNESTMVWCLGVILTELFDLSTTVFYWDDIYKFDDASILGYIDNVCRYKKLNNIYLDPAKKYTLENLYKDMLNFNNKKRISLNDIIRKINI